MRFTRFAAVLTLAIAAAPTLMAATRVTPDANVSSSALVTATKLPVNMELRFSLHSGGSLSAPFTKAIAGPSVTCWADIGYPGQVGSNVVSFNDWQCSPGIEQQISLVASLTDSAGTRYQFTKTCYSTQSCSYNPMSAPYHPGIWTAKADYAFVVAYDNSSSYWFGG